MTTLATRRPEQNSADKRRDIIVTPERINELAGEIQDHMSRSVSEIGVINSQSRILSMNAGIEAALAGDAGRSFAVVAREMGNLANKTAAVAHELEEKAASAIDDLAEISRQLATKVRGNRLADLALNNIDLIDRNLYERTCDVRWWATDSSVTDALGNDSRDARRFAAKRLGVILSAYTVYYDLVLANADGTVIANGRPDRYRSNGTQVADQAWYRMAMASKDGDEYGFQTVHASPLVNQQNVLVYSCGVRRDGQCDGELLGALGILFNWDALAQTVLLNTPIAEHEKAYTRQVIVDDDGLVLADSEGKILADKINFTRRDDLFDRAKDFAIEDIGGHAHLVAHAASPGYETYRTGWHSLILQKLSA